jgi:hypothetical protein
MASFTLIPFKKTQLNNLVLSAHANLTDDSLYLSFILVGDLEKINLGEYHPEHKRLKNLWEKTCFEFFIKNNQNEYLEFNFAPNFAWNCFHFKEIRGPLAEFDKVQNPEIEILNSNEKFFLVAKIKQQELPANFLKSSELNFSFNAVIKLKSGDNEFWALKHSDSKPNFHQFDSFIGKF